MKKISVLILVDKFDYHGSFINGPTRNYSWLVKRIDKNKFDIFLYALRKKGKSYEIFKNAGVKARYLGLGKYNPLTTFIIISSIIKHNIDVVHLQGYGAVLFGQIAAAILRKPTIIKEEWVDPNISFLQGYLEGFLGKFTTKVIAISDYAKRFLVEKKRIKDSKIVLIPNGIPLDDFQAATEADGEIIRKSMGIVEHETIVGIVGMLHENKGHKFFIEAAASVTRKNPATKFLIIGDGEMRTGLEDYAKQLKVADKVLFLGHRNDMPELFKALDIYVLASNSETWPTSLMEAMAAGRAVITTDCGGGSEIVVDGKTGLLVPVKNSKILTQKIEYLICEPEKRKELGRNALRESMRFDIKETVSAVELLYKSCLEN
jgi:glycosyltransferase involved in cell wall biosynthesis